MIRENRLTTAKGLLYGTRVMIKNRPAVKIKSHDRYDTIFIEEIAEGLFQRPVDHIDVVFKN